MVLVHYLEIYKVVNVMSTLFTLFKTNEGNPYLSSFFNTDPLKYRKPMAERAEIRSSLEFNSPYSKR